MFSYIKRCLHRHRGKIIFSGVLVGGLYAANRYAVKKLKDFQKQAIDRHVEREKRLQQFKKNEISCDQMIMLLAPSFYNAIDEIFSLEPFLEKLKSCSVEDRVVVWELIKVVVFSRLASYMYVGTVLVILVRIQLNIIGGYIYSEGHNGAENVNHITEELREIYLSLGHYFLTHGIKELCQLIDTHVKSILRDEPLQKQLSISDIERYFWTIQSTIVTSPENPIRNLDKYVFEPKINIDKFHLSHLDAKLLIKIVSETLDLLDTDEVKSLCTSCVNRGFSQAMDNVVEYFFYNNPYPQNLVPISEDDAEEVEVILPATLQAYAPSVRSPEISNDGKNIPPQKIKIPMVELIPIINKLTGLSDWKQWIQEFVNMHKLKLFGANVYEAFVD